MINYNCIKEVTRELRSTFKGMQSNSYGHCCTADYDMYHKKTNENDYVCAKIYKGGLNNDYDYSRKEFLLSDEVYFMWHLTEFKIDDVIEVMENVCNKYNYIVKKPKDESKCIVVVDLKNEEK